MEFYAREEGRDYPVAVYKSGVHPAQGSRSVDGRLEKV